MSNNRTNLRQGIHLHRDHIRRHFTLHIHLDTASSMHRHFHNRYNLRNMLTEGQLLDQ